MPTVTLQLFWIALSSFAACSLLQLAARRFFPRWNLLDFPARYGLTRAPLPYPTGILAVGTFIVFFLVLQDLTKQNLGILLSICLLTGVTIVDDRQPLPSSLRLSVQLIAGFLIFAFGTRIYSITNPLIADGIIKLDTVVIPSAFFSNPPLWSGLFTILWLLLTINALNWFDGIPGQVSLLSAIGFLVIGFLAISPRIEHVDPAHQYELALLAFALVGIAAACLLFDFPPARVLMGDTGAMFFGLMLGVLTVYAGGKVATAFLVLGVPLTDSGIVVLRRVLRGRSPLRGSQHGEHLHHRLVQCGWSERRIIALTAILGTSFGVTALFLSTRGKFIAALLLVAIMLSLSWYTERRIPHPNP